MPMCTPQSATPASTTPHRSSKTLPEMRPAEKRVQRANFGVPGIGGAGVEQPCATTSDLARELVPQGLRVFCPEALAPGGSPPSAHTYRTTRAIPASMWYRL